MNDLEAITPRQLRQILFHLRNQDMTVRDLRAMLFEAVGQDNYYVINHGMFERMMPSDSQGADEETQG